MDIVQENRELISAKTSDRVSGTQALLQPSRYGDEKFIPNGNPSTQHPTVGPVLVPHPMFTFKVGGTPFKMCSDPRPYTTDVLRMHSVKPFFGTISGLAFLKAQHGFPTGRKIDFVGFQIPVPQPVVAAAGNKRIAFLALAKCFFRALARFA